MKKLHQLAPIHIPIRKIWQNDIRTLRREPTIAQALQELQACWVQMTEFRRDDVAISDPQRAHEEFVLDLHIGQVKINDWYWLLETFEPDQLMGVQLAVCEYLYPDKEWEAVGVVDEHCVVTDRGRTLVSDLKLCDCLSASASLLLAGDTKMKFSPAVAEEVEAHHEGRRQMAEWRMAKMRKEIEAVSHNADVKPLNAPQ